MADTIYPGGADPFLRRYRKSKRPFASPEDYLPPADCDLNNLKQAIVPPPEVDFQTLERASIARRHAEYQNEFEGRSELLYLHSLLIAMLRRNKAPNGATPMFIRLWAEQGAFLCQQLSVRWLVSAATTFGERGETFEQRSAGMGFSILFDTIKLYESERRLSGQAANQPFDIARRSERCRIAFDMTPFSIKHGDLDRNMLARLWHIADQDDVIRPLADALLQLLMHDTRTAFARVQPLKAKL